MLVDRKAHGWARAIRMTDFELNDVRKWWAHQGEAGVSASAARRRLNARVSREGWNSPVRINTNEVKWWAHQDLNLGPIDYESTALTN